MRPFTARLGGDGALELPAGATVSALMAHLRVPPGEARITLVNGFHRPDDWPLSEGDTVAFFPPLEGG